MTRLVILSVPTAAGWTGVQRQLIAWRAPLDHAGVRLDPAVEPEDWSGDVTGLLTPVPADSVSSLVRHAVADDVDLLVLGSGRLEDTWRDPEAVANLSRNAAALETPLTVVAVVRDQLGVLNALYCDRVMGLHMARDFASFSSSPSPAERFDYAGGFASLVASAEMDFVAVPYSAPSDGSQALAVLDALGVVVGDLSATDDATGNPLPGPIEVAATRLLFKRMWRLGIFNSLPRKTLTATLRQLREHAAERSWDETTYWGWSPSLRDGAIATYQPGNDVFANAVWGRPWGDTWEAAPYTEVDLASQSPALVVDVLVTVDRLAKELQAAKAAAAEG